MKYNKKYLLLKKVFESYPKTFVLLLTLIILSGVKAHAQYPNAYLPDINWYYYNAQTVFATYPGYTLGTPAGASINGDLGGNPFTANFANPANLGNGGYGGTASATTGNGVTIAPYNWGAYVFRTNVNYYAPTQGNYIDLSWRGSGTSGAATAIPAGSTATVTFTNNLGVLDQLIVGDIGDGGGETVTFEFLDAAGNPVDISSNIRVIHLTNDAAGASAPLAYPSATSISLNATTPVTGVTNEGWAFTMLTTSVKSIKLTQTGSISSTARNSWSFTFAKSAPDRGDAPASYGNPSVYSLGGLLRLGAYGGDTEYNAIYSANADGDNTNNINNDEDGVSSITPIPNSGARGQVIPTYTITTIASNRSGTNATAIAWIDWNGNGMFDTDEAATSVNVPTGSNNMPVTFTWNNVILDGPVSASGTFARIIIATSILSTSDAATAISPGAGIGEIEDNFIPFAAALPVTFGNIQAKMKGNKLFVNWQSLTETNNDHFEIEASADGNRFTKIGEIKSKADGGNSSVSLDYNFNTDALGGALSLSGGILALLGLGLGLKRRNLAGVVATVVLSIAVLVAGCNKNDGSLQENTGKVYIRVAQVDIDGTKSYSKVVTVVKE